MSTIIEVRGLTKHFGTTKAVDDVSFSVEEQDALVLIGTSGCGKTTLLKMLNRLLEPDSGKVWINGEDILQQDVISLRRQMGYVIQSTGLFPHYSVYQNIATVPKLLGWPGSRIKDRVYALLDQFGLDHAEAAKLPAQLSGGQQQRVGVCRALAADPPIILMDEPFGALDPITKNTVIHDFMQLEAMQQKTIVMVTHDMAEAVQVGDHICLMDEGRIMQLGTPRELVLHPASDFVKSFFEGRKMQLQMEVVHHNDIAELLHLPKDQANPTMTELMRKATEDESQATTLAGKQVTSKQLMEAFYDYLSNVKA